MIKSYIYLLLSFCGWYDLFCGAIFPPGSTARWIEIREWILNWNQFYLQSRFSWSCGASALKTLDDIHRQFVQNLNRICALSRSAHPREVQRQGIHWTILQRTLAKIDCICSGIALPDTQGTLRRAIVVAVMSSTDACPEASIVGKMSNLYFDHKYNPYLE